jgi:hypothetical protein
MLVNELESLTLQTPARNNAKTQVRAKPLKFSRVLPPE